MTQLTVTAKGQVTLRKDLLKHLGLKPGTVFEWVSRNYDQTISLRIGGKSCNLGVPAAAGVWVAKGSRKTE